MKKEFGECLTEEIEARISRMEEASYEFPKRFSKKDYLFTVAVILLCLGGVIWGAFIV